MKKIILVSALMCLFSVNTYALYGPKTQMALCLAKYSPELCRKAAGRALAGFDASCNAVSDECLCHMDFPDSSNPCN